MNKITPKQERFCQEYLIDLNATQAAVRAGYSKNTANSQGTRLLLNASVQNHLQKLRLKQAERLNRSADNVLIDIYNTGLKAEEAGEYNTRLKALELEGKHKGMFKDKVEVSGNPNAPIEVNLGVSPIVQSFLDKLKGEADD